MNNDIRRINPTKRWSDITLYNGIAHFVEVADNLPCGDMAAQTQQILDQAEQKLKLIHSDKTRILSVAIYVTDFAQLDQLNAVWEAWFAEGTAPSRSCVKVELADPDLLVEMAFVAAEGSAEE